VRSAIPTIGSNGHVPSSKPGRIPFCPPLTLPERPRRLPATRGFFFDPSLEGRLGTVRTVLSQLSTKIGDLSLERRDLALQRSDQLLDFGGKTHPTLDSDSQPQVSYVPPLESKFNETVTFQTHHALGVTSAIFCHHNALDYKGKIFLLTAEARPSSRQNSSLLISKENSRDLSSARGFDHCRQRSVDFFSDRPKPSETSRRKKTVKRLLPHESITEQG
jgi:hypothetical protein